MQAARPSSSSSNGADAKAVECAARQVVDVFDPTDVRVNNAFAGVFAPVAEVTPDE